MRFLIFAVSYSVLIGCSQESPSPPIIDIDLTRLNAEAANLIETNTKTATTSKAWKELGMLYHAHGLEESAILAYEYSLQLQPDSQTEYLMAVGYARLGKYEQALDRMSHITNYLPSEWRQGFWQLDLGNNELALLHFKNALEQDPTSAASKIGLARTHLSLGQPNQAIQLLQSLVDEGRDHHYISLLLGKANQQAGKLRIAEQLLKAARSGRPKWIDPWIDEMLAHQLGFSAELTRAIGKIDTRNLQDALIAFTEIDNKYPFDPVVQNNLATVQMQLGNNSEAIRILGNAIQLSPRYAPFHLTMAFAMADVGEVEQAKEFAKQALVLQPSMFAAARFIGKLAYRQKDFRLALQFYSSAIQLGDGNLRTREMLAEVLLRFKDWENAIFQYEIVLSIDPKRTASIGGLAYAFANNGQLQHAIKILEEANIKFPNDPNLARAVNAIELASQTP